MTVVNSSHVSEMASRLVETVMINVDDFADSFLTCGTCFTGYDSHERAAKLLPCSHTICRSCLDRILETQAQSTSFRCPICRETIPVPNGGAASFPPAFIVNQLLDLLATQRRDVVPKCRMHANQELLFCETCDVVFCAECRGRSHNAQLPCGGTGTTGPTHFDGDDHCGQQDNGVDASNTVLASSASAALNHNVISFNVAIKRCTEIMLYKMHLCVQELNNAQDAVTAELDRLAANKNICIEAVNSRFAEIIALVERRQAELLDEVKRLADDKYRALTEQLALIESEREAVRRECNSLKGILDVRTISKAISYLNGKLDTVTALTEPRENAFLRYQDNSGAGGRLAPASRSSGSRAERKSSQPPAPTASSPIATAGCSATGPTVADDMSTAAAAAPGGSGCGSSLLDISRCLAAFGRIIVSTTYPALCTARLPSQLVMNLYSRATIRAVDYHGRPQSSGGADPVEVKLTDADGRLVPTELLDAGDGSYELILRPLSPGTHQLSVQILSRPIRGSPFHLPVRRAQQRRWCLNEGTDGRGLIQPFAVTSGPYPSDDISPDGSVTTTPTAADNPQPVYVYLLDTGNSRLLVVDPDTGKLHRTLVGEALAGQAATGVAWSPQGLWIVNWRARRVYLLDPRTDQVVHSIYSSQFIEPTSVFRCPVSGQLFVADNGAGCVFLCNPITGHTAPFVGAGAGHDTNAAIGTTADSNEAETTTPPGTRSCGAFAPLEPRSWRQISGLCVTHNGELILSTGSTIRIFSRSGKQLNCLVPPNMVTTTVTSSSPRTMAQRPVSCTPNYDRSSAPTNACTTRPTPNRCTTTGLPDRLGLRPTASPTHRANTCAPRGQFGGVCVAPAPPTDVESPDNLGMCLLASYSDRKRSGIVVWPEFYWTTPRNGPRLEDEDSADDEDCSDASTSGTDDEDGSGSSGSSLDASTKSSSHWADLASVPEPYMVEAEPGFRRLAGLFALHDSRHLVVVDQGAQSLCRLRYA